MSHEKIKSMSVKELPNGNIRVKMCSAANNIFPLNYQDYTTEITWENLFLYLNGGIWQPNESANNGLWWALTNIVKAIAEKDGYVSYKLYEMSYDIHNAEENKLILKKYVDLFKLYHLVLTKLPKTNLVVLSDNGCIIKMTANKMWSDMKNAKKHSLFKCIILYFRAKKDFGRKNAKILATPDLGVYTKQIVELVNTL